MIAMHNRMVSIEAAVKYFTMGALAAAFCIWINVILCNNWYSRIRTNGSNIN